MDVGRLIGVMIIVVLHAGTAVEYVGRGMERTVWSFLCWGVAPLAIPALFFLSGYLFAYNASPAPYTTKLTRRIKHLAVPYFAWNLLCLALFLGAAHLFPRVAMRTEQYGLDTLSGIGTKLFDLATMPVVQPLWYLRALFLLTLVAPLITALLGFYKHSAHYRTAFIAVCITALVALEQAYVTFPPYAAVTFLVGAGCAQMRINLTVACYDKRWWLLGWSLIVAMLTFWLEPLPYLTQLLLCSTAPTLWAFTPYFAKWEQRLGAKARLLAPVSFFIFAGHFLFASTLLHLIGPHLPQKPGMLTLLCLIFTFAGTALCLLAWLIGRRLCPKLLAAFDGTLSSH